MYITELPFKLPGRVFASPMPFGMFDRFAKSLVDFKNENVSVIVLLNEEPEYRYQSGRDLKAFYIEEGFEVIHLPIPDFSSPTMEELEPALEQAIEHARAGRNVVVHCLAGLGRTGLFLGVMARRLLGLDGDEAISWVRKYRSGAIQTAQQEAIVRQ